MFEEFPCCLPISFPNQLCDSEFACPVDSNEEVQLTLSSLALAPFCNCFRVDPELLAQRRERSLLSLYCCSHGVRGRGAAMTYLSHNASFHSHENITPSPPGTRPR